MAVLIVWGCTGDSPEHAGTRAGDAVPGDRDASVSDLVEVTLYFTDRRELETADCNAVLPISRRVPSDSAHPEGVLRVLLGGTLPEEREAGLSDSFQPDPAVRADRPLVEFLTGLEVRGDTAYVDFTSEALGYLNSAACLQGAVKAPIERTLQTFPQIDIVRYRIDGEVFEDWDA